VNLTELSGVLTAATDVLRVETLDAYSSASDADMVAAYLRGDPKPDPEAKRPWLDRLAAAAERGHPWRRLRVVPRPVPDYIRYACEWGYLDNVAAGEDVRVLDAAIGPYLTEGIRQCEGDLYIADGRVITMDYGPDGAFRTANYGDPEAWADSVEHLAHAWVMADPFTDWWARNRDLHRDHLAHA
jgi:hypothetical protein